MEDNKEYCLLIIDDNKDYNQSLVEHFDQLDYKTIQAFSDKEAVNIIEEGSYDPDMVILNLDLASNNSEDILKLLENKTDAKIVLLSKNEDPKKREYYFQRGIWDYHLTSTSVKYIADDIHDALKRLKINKNETILVIDDSKLSRNIVKNILENRNYNVLCAQNALDGIQLIKNNDISILILDMELPDLHGIELLERLRDEYRIRKFPILVLSGSNNPSIVRQALKKGSSDFLRKPLQYEEFLLKIDLWVETSRRQSTIKKQKKQIENSLITLDCVVNSTLEAMFMFENNTCTELNDEALKLTGFQNKDEILGKNIFDIFTDVSNGHRVELLDEKVDHLFEDQLIDKSGKQLQVQIKERNVQIGNKTLKIIAVMDITDIKQQEKMLSHQTKMASMGEMIGNIAHQWRQPLTAISVAAGGIKLNYELDMVDEKEILSELDNIVNNTQFLSNTIEDFQNFLKDDRSMVHYSINEALDKTTGIVSANLESYEINVIKVFDENIYLNGKLNDLIQVLLNIINNAADILKTFKESNLKKYILIDAKKQNDNIVLTVQDSAGGIPDNIIGKIFEPYFTTKHQSQGTGLGLYMSHQIITEGMKGEIKVQNEHFTYEGKEYTGAKFVISFPLDLKN
jgi:PAS domain S-box-containing protein